jgi:ABC-type antimicrobial peptide transport system permease subunit
MQKTTPNGQQALSRTFYPLGSAMRSSISGIEQVTSVHCQQRYQLTIGSDTFEDRSAFFVDPSYGKVFDIKWLAGSPETSLKDLTSAVVTDEFARQYFGQESALGKTFVIDNKLQVIVTGIVAAPPLNTDHPYRIILPYAALQRFLPTGQVDSWENVGNGSTYFVLAGKGDLSNVQTQLETLKHQYLPAEEANNTRFHFIHLRDMHFRNGDYSGYNYEFPQPVAIMLSIIAGLITLICCSNFINLATAQAIKRSKEIGIRKTFGSSRQLLVIQFLGETFALIVLSMTLGLFIAKMALLKLNALMGLPDKVPLQFNFWQEPSVIWFILLMIASLTLLSGLYPSVVLSGFKPVAALKNQVPSGKSRGVSFRKSLVFLQFFGSQMLVLVTLIILNQINYLSGKPAGFDTGSVLLLDVPEDDVRKISWLKDKLSKVPGVRHVSVASAYPFGAVESIRLNINDSLTDFQVAGFYIDESYMVTFGLKLLSGSPSSSATPAGEVLVNQTLLKQLRIENSQAAIGRTIRLNGEQAIIAGVVQDYSTDAFQKSVRPLVLLHNTGQRKQVALKLEQAGKKDLMNSIQDTWQSVYPSYLYKPFWVEDALTPQYGFFEIIFDMLRLFSAIAILIAGLGLYNFASYLIMQRTKEIGIRKVLGSSERQIFNQLFKSLISPMILAFLFACPLAYMLGNAALQEFQDRVMPGILLFSGVFGCMLLLSFFAVAYRTYRAACINPVKVLKYD